MTNKMSQQTKKCPSCQKEISFSITKCPYCGRDFRSWFRRHLILTGLGAFIAFTTFVSMFSYFTKERGVPATKPETTAEETTPGEPEEKKEEKLTPTTEPETTVEEAVPSKPEEKEKKPAPQTKTYQQVFTFSGDGAKTSEPFIITGDRFRIKYDCGGDLCQAFLTKPTSEWDIQLIMNSANPVKDETIFYGAGEYYINSNSLGSYSMVVEDYK